MPELNAEESEWLTAADRQEANGWTRIRIAGEPYVRGFQYGYLVADLYAEARDNFAKMTYHRYGKTLEFFAAQAVRMHSGRIGTELIDEMHGTVRGLAAAGVTSSLEELIGWNAWMELTEYWWPTASEQYSVVPSKGPSGSHCSGFIATGSATTDGKIVIGHESFDDFWTGQHFNIVLDITPADGFRMVMQTVPGYFASMTDFWITGAGLAITETTIACFRGYNETKTPEYVRARNACQYADSIDSWIELMNQDNNGGYANTWMIGDTNTGEIARYEEGMLHQKLDRTFDGVFTGSNVAEDPRIRAFETYDSGYDDPRQHTGARRLRWIQLMDVHQGTIDVATGKRMLADTFDPYLGYENPSSRTICAHFDSDPMHFASDPHGVWNTPFVPAGSVDAKVAHADDIAELNLWARFGRADGIEFDAEAFLRDHPLWRWQSGVLRSRPSQPWTYFNSSKQLTQQEGA